MFCCALRVIAARAKKIIQELIRECDILKGF
jgi:hypothetical protein